MTDFHAFERGGENYLFFPRSARLYELSRPAVRILSELPERRVEDPGDPQGSLRAELRQLLQREMKVPKPASHMLEESNISYNYQTFSLYLAQSCNMSCCYCWNQGGSFGKPLRMMGRARAHTVAKKIASLISGSRAGKIFVNFYGGEPLLNVPAMSTIVAELRRQESSLGKTIHFTLDTNGTLMEGKTAQFLAQHFTQIGVSLDGRQEIHDLQRLGKHGECTWQRIVNNVKAFPNPKLLGLRATLTDFSDSYLETFQLLTTLGVSRIQLEYCHEPGYRGNPIFQKLVVPLERQVAELLEFIDYYIDLISGYSSSADIPYSSSLIDTVARIRRGNRFTRPCGAGINTMAIDSRGEIFPCIAFVGRRDFVMGRAGREGGGALKQTLIGLDVDSHDPCHNCWLRYDCAGGCYATHYDMTGGTGQPHPAYCDSMRSRAEVYYYALAQMMKKCPWHLEESNQGL